MSDRAGRRGRPRVATAAPRAGRLGRIRVAPVVAVLAIVVLGPTASAGAATTQEFSLGPSSSNPNDIVSGPGGTLWVTVDGGFARVTPGTGAVSRVTAGLSPGSQPWALATGPAGSLWFTTNDEETGDGNGVVGRITAGATVQERPDESLDQPSALRDVAGRPDGTAVYVGNADAGLGIFSEVDDGPLYDVTDFDAGANQNPTSVALAPDGSAWYTGTDDPSTIGKATFAPRREDYAATYSEFPVPPGDAFYDAGAAEDIVAGPDGGMWFTLPSVSAVGRVDIVTGAVSIVRTAAGSAPTGIALGPDRAIWFTDAGPVPGIGRIDPITRTVTERTDGFSSADARPRRITTGPDGAMWFTVPGSNAVGRVDPTTFAAAPPAPDPPAPDPPPAPAPPEPVPDPPVTPPAPPPPAVPEPTPIAPVPAPAPAAPAPEAPVARDLRFQQVSRGVRVRSPRRVRLRFSLNRAATVRVSVGGTTARSRVLAADRTIQGRAGVNRLMLPRLAPGLHVVTLRATSPDGRRATVRVRVRVLAARRAAPAFTG